MRQFQWLPIVASIQSGVAVIAQDYPAVIISVGESPVLQALRSADDALDAVTRLGIRVFCDVLLQSQGVLGDFTRFAIRSREYKNEGSDDGYR
jgi:HD-like signal output (HDOD) protein